MNTKGALGNALLELDRSLGMEEALRESEARFRSLLEEAPIAYHEIDSEGIVLRVNRVECQLLGYDASSMVGQHVWNFVAPDERPTSRQAVLEKISGVRTLGVFTRNYINGNHIDRIQVFQRLHGRTEFEGTGIGLSVCRRIAERHRGDITAQSSPGQGARFIVTLPVEQNISST